MKYKNWLYFVLFFILNNCWINIKLKNSSERNQKLKKFIIESSAPNFTSKEDKELQKNLEADKELQKNLEVEQQSSNHTKLFLNRSSEYSAAQIKINHSNGEVHLVAPIKQLWPEDKECERFFVGYGENISSNVLFSFQRSGSHWLTYLLSCSTGLLPTINKTLFPEIQKTFANDSWRGDSRSFIIKTHHVPAETENRFELFNVYPTIILVRNPLRCIMSIWDFIHETKLATNRRLSHQAQKGFEHFLELRLKVWRRLFVDHLPHHKTHYLLVFYENLVENPISELRKILQFLNISADEERIKCLERNIEGPFKRKHQQIKPFNSKAVAKGQAVVKDFLQVLSNLNISYPKSYLKFMEESIY